MTTHVNKIKVSMPYKEETARFPVAMMLLAVVLLSVPLIFWILKINNEGSLTSNVAKYDSLISTIDTDLNMVEAYLNNDAEELAALKAGRNAPVVTLIVPEVVIVEGSNNKQVSALKVSLDGIYWSPNKPLAGINGDTYGEGDIIQGYEIVRIGKSKVHFQAPDGTIVVKDMDGELLNGK